jgi:hypothetical protein
MPANGVYARLRGNVEVQSSELELYVQERLTPIFCPPPIVNEGLFGINDPGELPKFAKTGIQLKIQLRFPLFLE